VIRLHDLRHTNASIALAAGVDIKVVSDRLGHSTTAITADLYTHVNRNVGRSAADRIAEVLAAADQTLPSERGL
jgi:integrase